MNVNEIVQRVTSDFADIYSHFKDFQQNDKYLPYWEKCVESIKDRDFLMCVIFCNDVFSIPPVKTFLTYYRDDFVRLTGNERAQLDLFVKRGIGAFWGMVFKGVLGYKDNNSVSVSMNDYFMVKTASLYSGRDTPLVIE